MLARRYRCARPECPKVQAAVKNKMATSNGDRPIYIDALGRKTPISDSQRADMRAGRLDSIPAGTIRKFLNGGFSFAIDDER